MLEQLSHLIIQLIQTSGYVGIFILMTLESALLPIPSEVTMPFAGFLSQQGHLSLWAVIVVGAIGNLFGSLIGYAIGYFLEETVILNLIKRYGKFFLISEHEYVRAVHWFQKYGNPITFFSRLLPAVRTLISLPAGLAEMNIWMFSLYTLIGSLLWSTVLAWVGFYLGSNWNSIHPYFQKFQLVIIVLLALAVLWYINHKLKIVKLGKKS